MCCGKAGKPVLPDKTARDRIIDLLGQSAKSC
jgi:hypothetical protein